MSRSGAHERVERDRAGWADRVTDEIRILTLASSFLRQEAQWKREDREMERESKIEMKTDWTELIDMDQSSSSSS
jgi:hypothetical protein